MAKQPGNVTPRIGDCVIADDIYPVPGAESDAEREQAVLFWFYLDLTPAPKEGADMVENQHQKITGYRDLTQEEIDLMNEAKAFEAKAAELHGRVEAAIRAAGELSPQQARDLSMARSAYEDATIRMVRAIAHPVSPWFPREGGR